MTDPIRAWREEHAYFQKLLDALHVEVDVFYAGDSPNYQLMLDIITYLREYSDQYHHPREDEAFRRLARRAPDRQLPLARLIQEHQVIAHAGEKLRNLLEEAASDAMVSRTEIEVAAATYLVYYGNHIAKEEEEVLPRAAKELTEEDWKAVKDAAPAGHDPLFGRNPEARFKALRHRIAVEAG